MNYIIKLTKIIIFMTFYFHGSLMRFKYSQLTWLKMMVMIIANNVNYTIEKNFIKIANYEKLLIC